MKNIFVLIFVLSFSSMCFSQQNCGTNPVVKETKGYEPVLALLLAQAEAWNGGDIEGFMNGYWNSPELTFIGHNGPTKGWEPVLQNYKSSYSNKELMGTLCFDQLSFERLSGTIFRVTGAWHLQRAEPVGGWFTLIVKKIKKDWKVIYDHTS